MSLKFVFTDKKKKIYLKFMTKGLNQYYTLPIEVILF